MSQDTPIRLEDVSKKFRLYTNRAGSLKEQLVARGGKRHEEFWALRNVSFEVPHGSTMGLIGHNGCGKSTTLRLVTGIYKPTSGTVSVKGRISALLELGSGFHPDLSGRENVYLNAAILGLSSKEIDLVFDDIVDFAGIGEFIDAPVKVYSSGMFVRLGFAVAVHASPEILVVDEVVAVGDEEFQRRCYEHIYQLRNQGVTIMLVTHNLGLVQTMCDHAAWFDHGRILTQGPAPAVVAEYLAKVNLEEGELLEAEVTEEVESGTVRRGSGEILATSVSFRDRSGAVVRQARPGEPLTVRIEYDAADPVVEPVFSVSVRHEGGTGVGATSTYADGFSTGTISGKGVVEFEMAKLPLLTGNFDIAVYITDRRIQHVFDAIEPGFRLLVRGDQIRTKEGFVELGGTWKLRADVTDRLR